MLSVGDDGTFRHDEVFQDAKSGQTGTIRLFGDCSLHKGPDIFFVVVTISLFVDCILANNGNL